MAWLSTTHPIAPQTPEERLLWHCMVWTYGYYVLGALYVLAPVVGWVMTVRLARRDGLARMPLTVWVWIAGMAVMWVALIVAHAQHNLGIGPMVKGSIGWAKGWALIALFMLIGCQGGIRLVVLARASSWVGIQTLCIVPILIASWIVHLPGHLYVSPISMVGGPGPEFFSVELYGRNPGGGARWRLFAPWAPGLGMVMCVHMLLALNDPDRRLRWLGIAGMVLAILVSASRLGLLAMPIILGLVWLLTHLGQPLLWLAGAPLALLVGVLADPLMALRDEAMSKFHGARADSSRVRAALGRIALHRWERDGFTWGHGGVERGPHLVEHMPIGSHHTWFGLLFVKGLAGALALALPMIWTLLALLPGARHSPERRTGLRLLVLLFLYTFAENLEILSYLYWPGLVALGIAMKTPPATAPPATAGMPAHAPAPAAQPPLESPPTAATE